MMTFSLPATQRYNAAAHAGIGCVPMTAATRSRTETNLPFMVAVGALRLQFYTTETDPVKVTGLRFIANGDEGVAGAAAVAMNYLEEGQSGEPRLTMAADAAKEVAVDCGEGVVLSTDADYPTQFAVALPPQTFDQGFTIELTDDRGRTMEITKPAESASPVTIVRREFYAMKAIEFKPEPEAVDLGKPANCYIVSQAGTYMFPAELVDGTAIKGSFDTVDWTWRTTGVELSDIAYVDGYIRFTVKKFVKGNASISAYDAQQHLMLHNWHIWLTDAPQEMGTVAGASSPYSLTGTSVPWRPIPMTRTATACSTSGDAKTRTATWLRAASTSDRRSTPHGKPSRATRSIGTTGTSRTHGAVGRSATTIRSVSCIRVLIMTAATTTG